MTSDCSHQYSSHHYHLVEINLITWSDNWNLLAALKSQKTHRLLAMNSFIPVVGELVKRSWKVTGLASLVPSAMPPTCTETIWLPTTVLDTVISWDVFLTGNSAGELYTVNAIDRALLSFWMLLMISCGRESAAFKLGGSSSDAWESDVDSSNSWESID